MWAAVVLTRFITNQNQPKEKRKMDRSEKNVDETPNDCSDTPLLELNDLELAYVGGGSADPIYH